MNAPAKFLFEDDFAANAKPAKPTVSLAAHQSALARAEEDGYRQGVAAAEAQIAGRTAAACERVAQTLMRHVDKDKLGVALKGANDTVRQFFLGNMSSRAAKMLVDDMQALGPVRLRDVDEAQALLVNLAKDLAAKGEIMISKNRADDELVM